MKRNSSWSTRGYTLIEMLVYVAIFGMMLVLCMRLFSTTSRISAYSIQASDRLDDIRDAQRVFLETMRAATAIADGVGEYVTGEDVLVLRMHGAGETPRHVVMGTLDGRSRLNVMEVVYEDGVLKATRYLRCRLPVEALRFTIDEARRGVTLDITPRPVLPDRRTPPVTRRVKATLRVCNPEV